MTKVTRPDNTLTSHEMTKIQSRWPWWPVGLPAMFIVTTGDDPENYMTTSDDIWWRELMICMGKSTFACLAAVISTHSWTHLLSMKWQSIKPNPSLTSWILLALFRHMHFEIINTMDCYHKWQEKEPAMIAYNYFNKIIISFYFYGFLALLLMFVRLEY